MWPPAWLVLTLPWVHIFWHLLVGIAIDLFMHLPLCLCDNNPFLLETCRFCTCNRPCSIFSDFCSFMWQISTFTFCLMLRVPRTHVLLLCIDDWSRVSFQSTRFFLIKSHKLTDQFWFYFMLIWSPLICFINQLRRALQSDGHLRSSLYYSLIPDPTPSFVSF